MTVLSFNLRKLFHLPKNRLLMGAVAVLIAITSLMTKWYAHSDPVITTVEHVTQSSIKPSTIDQDISAPVPKRIVLSNQFGDINIRSGPSSRYPKVITISVGSLFFLDESKNSSGLSWLPVEVPAGVHCITHENEYCQTGITTKSVFGWVNSRYISFN